MTLIEVVTSVGLLSLISIALVYTQMFGLRYNQLTCSKLGASDKSRMGFDRLTRDIRQAMSWRIGYGDVSNFSIRTNGDQVGNALQIWYTADTNAYVRYFFDTNQLRLYRMTNGMTTASLLVENLTNASGDGMTFRAQDYLGSSVSCASIDVTNANYKSTILTTLEFCQYQYPLTKVGPKYYYNYYRIRFRTASHNCSFP